MKNKHTVFLTGASRGIGQAIAKKLEEEGYRVIKPSHKEMDLSDNRSIDSYLSKLKTPVDILVNNAGINELAHAVDITDDNIVRTLQVNLAAPIKITKFFIPQMIGKKYGRILNISSVWSALTKPGRLIYSASKSGLSGATRTWAVELAQYNIMVNAVAPGFVDTRMTRENNTRMQIEQLEKSTPIKRLAHPSEIAEVAAFLVSEKNTYLTGQTIFVDGGFTCV